MDVVLRCLFEQDDGGEPCCMIMGDFSSAAPRRAITHCAMRVHPYCDSIIVHRHNRRSLTPQTNLRALARAGMADEDDAAPVVVNAGGMKDQPIHQDDFGAEEQFARADIEQALPNYAGALLGQSQVIPRGVGAANYADSSPRIRPGS